MGMEVNLHSSARSVRGTGSLTADGRGALHPQQSDTIRIAAAYTRIMTVLYQCQGRNARSNEDGRRERYFREGITMPFMMIRLATRNTSRGGTLTSTVAAMM